jgi:hypothetical protein
MDLNVHEFAQGLLQTPLFSVFSPPVEEHGNIKFRKP